MIFFFFLLIQFFAKSRICFMIVEENCGIFSPLFFAKIGAFFMILWQNLHIPRQNLHIPFLIILWRNEKFSTKILYPLPLSQYFTKIHAHFMILEENSIYLFLLSFGEIYAFFMILWQICIFHNTNKICTFLQHFEKICTVPQYFEEISIFLEHFHENHVFFIAFWWIFGYFQNPFMKAMFCL